MCWGTLDPFRDEEAAHNRRRHLWVWCRDGPFAEVIAAKTITVPHTSFPARQAADVQRSRLTLLSRLAQVSVEQHGVAHWTGLPATTPFSGHIIAGCKPRCRRGGRPAPECNRTPATGRPRNAREQPGGHRIYRSEGPPPWTMSTARSSSDATPKARHMMTPETLPTRILPSAGAYAAAGDDPTAAARLDCEGGVRESAAGARREFLVVRGARF
jgi:hypothetical protein